MYDLGAGRRTGGFLLVSLVEFDGLGLSFKNLERLRVNGNLLKGMLG